MEIREFLLIQNFKKFLELSNNLDRIDIKSIVRIFPSSFNKYNFGDKKY